MGGGIRLAGSARLWAPAVQRLRADGILGRAFETRALHRFCANSVSMKSNREIYRATGLPLLQNRAFNSADEARACATGDVVLVQDLKTGLIFNEAFDPSLIDYDTDYQNEQAFSDVFRRHLEGVAQVVERHFHETSLIEIGCGKAYFLETLQRMGY